MEEWGSFFTVAPLDRASIKFPISTYFPVRHIRPSTSHAPLILFISKWESLRSKEIGLTSSSPLPKHRVYFFSHLGTQNGFRWVSRENLFKISL